MEESRGGVGGHGLWWDPVTQKPYLNIHPNFLKMLKKLNRPKLICPFFSDKDVNNEPRSAEFVTIIYTENAMIRASSVQNEMLHPSLQRVYQRLTIVEAWAMSHKWTRVSWPISHVKLWHNTYLLLF